VNGGPSTETGLQKRQIGERKHTTDSERQLLLEYYHKYGTCTTVPSFVDLQRKLGWDGHRTKIWLYNRKTYHHHRQSERQRKRLHNGTSAVWASGVNSDGGATVPGSSYVATTTARTALAHDEHMAHANYSDDTDDDDDMTMDYMVDEPRRCVSTDNPTIQQTEEIQEYIITLEQSIAKLQHQLNEEMEAHKAETSKYLARIASLEISLSSRRVEESSQHREPLLPGDGDGKKDCPQRELTRHNDVLPAPQLHDGKLKLPSVEINLATLTIEKAAQSLLGPSQQQQHLQPLLAKPSHASGCLHADSSAAAPAAIHPVGHRLVYSSIPVASGN